MAQHADSAWVESVRVFLRTHYEVRLVKCPQIAELFYGHVEPDVQGLDIVISYQSIRNTFSRRKDPRPPTIRMITMFAHIKQLQRAGKLKSFPDMPLRETIYNM